MEEIKKKLFAAEDAHKEWFEEISRTVFQHPELGDREFFSSQYLADEMRKAGFRVEKPYCGMTPCPATVPTATRTAMPAATTGSRPAPSPPAWP